MDSDQYDIRPEAADLLSFWRESRGDFVLPPRNTLDPIRLKPWINNLSVVEYRADEKRYFVRLYSQFTQDHLGQNLARTYFDEALPPTALAVALQPYEAAMSARKPTLSIIMPQLYPNLFKRLDRIVLPFTNEIPPGPNARVDRFVTWIGPTLTQTAETTQRDATSSSKTLNLRIMED